jgi:uncharacterized membrane protein
VETAKASAMSSGRPSRDWLAVTKLILTIIGILITGYIFVTELVNAETICPRNATFNCDLVQHSIYSKVGPIPVIYLGLGGYLAILLVLLMQNRVPFLTERGKLIVFALTLFGFLFSAYLTYVEAFVLQAWCIWCLSSAITMTLLFLVSLADLWRSISTLPDLEEDEA